MDIKRARRLNPWRSRLKRSWWGHFFSWASSHAVVEPLQGVTGVWGSSAGRVRAPAVACWLCRCSAPDSHTNEISKEKLISNQSNCLLGFVFFPPLPAYRERKKRNDTIMSLYTAHSTPEFWNSGRFNIQVCSKRCVFIPRSLLFYFFFYI